MLRSGNRAAQRLLKHRTTGPRSGNRTTEPLSSPSQICIAITRNLHYNPLMRALEIPVPDDLDLAIGSSHNELTQMARTAFALRLFELGKITSGRAADIAGMPRRRFLLETAHHGIPSVSWDEEELAAEDATLKAHS
ncbi:MAG: UPF0175 family protein [Verrucomicrobia bacterium]|nr:UPF0175 family protein [Verrucomicrobiota bacterium]